MNMPMTVEIRSLSGIDAAPFFDDLSRLRITVFRAFPYLYDGSFDYEHTYLSTYAKAEGAVFVLAIDGDKIVGMSTGMPMMAETDEVRHPSSMPDTSLSKSSISARACFCLNTVAMAWACASSRNGKRMRSALAVSNGVPSALSSARPIIPAVPPTTCR